jgi:hypothetical protein
LQIKFASQRQPLDWASPIFRLRFGAINQYQIISSRISIEIFIDLLYCIETGERLTSKKSKLKKFRTWLQDVHNKFHYFAHVLLIAYRFDRELRAPEVHGSSSSPRSMLMLQTPTFEDINKQFHLNNVLINIWNPLIEILNDTRPTSMTYVGTSQFEGHQQWFKTYMSGDDDAIEAKLDEMLSSID